MSEKAIEKREDKPMEFIPFGSKDTIRLSVAIVRRLVAQPTTSGKLPSDDDCIKFLMMAQARRLNPFEGDAFMLGYDTKSGPKFSLITAHQAFLKRAELNPEYDGMESGVIVLRNDEDHSLEGDYMWDDDKLMGAWAKVYFKNRTKPMHKRVKLSTFWKDSPLWKSNTAGMIVKCAEADALRSSFPTMLGGLYLKEELVTTMEAPTVTTPIFKSDKLAVIPKVEAEVVDVHAVNLEHVTALANKDGIPLDLLVEFMRSEGTLQFNAPNLVDASKEDLQLVIDNWGDYVPRIKGVQ